MAGGFKLARGRGAGTAQTTLVACAVIAVVIVLLGKAESSAFNAARARMSDWAQPLLTGLRAPVAGFKQWQEGLSTLFTVYRENARLRQENAELRKWQEAALTLEQRVHRYELLVNAVPDPKLSTVAARVIGQSNRPFIKTMILNGGKDQTIRAGEAVMDERGLIGRVYLTGDKTSWVLLLTDLNSHVPVVVLPSRRRAILTGDNSTAPFLALDLGDGPVKAGDRVFSSGDGGLLPPDLPIGEVVTSGSELRVALFADPERSDYVHVVDYTAPLEPPPGVAADSLPAVAPSKPADIVGAVAPASVGPAATPARPLAGGGQAALAVSRNLAQVVRPAGRVAVPPSPTSDEEEGHGSGEE